MEAISGMASLSQLAVYVNCTVTRLSHLYRTISKAASLAKSQLEELHVLLKILERIEKHHCPSDTELLVPVLISIANTVQTLENWFSPSSTIWLQWNLIAHKADIEEALRLLRRKYHLLAFYYTERNNCALSRIESSLNAHHHAVSGSSADIPFPNLEKKSKPTRSDMDRASWSTMTDDGELDLEKPIDGSSTAAQGRELTVYKGNQASSPSASGNPSNPATAGAQSEQFPGQGEGGSSKEGVQTSTKIEVAEINCTQTTSNLFNNISHPNDNFYGKVMKITTKGGFLNIGNGSLRPVSKKRTKKKHPSNSSRAAEKEVERAKAGQDKK